MTEAAPTRPVTRRLKRRGAIRPAKGAVTRAIARLSDEEGAATAEYAVATMAAVIR
jgi:hypothetical protein